MGAANQGQQPVPVFNNQHYYGDERFPEHQYYENVNAYEHPQ
jgi:hypothetical protein